MKLVISILIITFMLTFESSDSSPVKAINVIQQNLEIPKIIFKDTTLKTELKILKNNIKKLEKVVDNYKKETKDTIKSSPKKTWFDKMFSKVKL